MSTLDLRQLEYFACTADAGSFAQAANRLFVAPQAVSKGVQRLEASIGTPLFERTANGIMLTEFGTLFLHKTKEALSKVSELERLAQEHLEDASRKSVIIGVNPLCGARFGGTLGGGALVELQKHNPSANLRFVELQGSNVIHDVKQGRLDFGISGTMGEHQFACVELARYTMGVIVAENSPLYHGNDTVTFEELSDGTMISSPGENDFYQELEHLARKQGVTLKTSPLQAFVDDEMPDDGSFVVRPLQHAMRMASHTKDRALMLMKNDGTPVERSLYLFWNERDLSKEEKHLVECIREIYTR
ncbi:MAG: LysR family transcriptional regulator [Slackia sp.]|nr:LysR family transcriptional regulator [Slackia sp.]